MTPKLTDRLARLEAVCTAAPVRLSPEEAKEAAQRYEASFGEPERVDPRAMAYWATATVQRLSADYEVMLKGAPAPWERLP